MDIETYNKAHQLFPCKTKEDMMKCLDLFQDFLFNSIYELSEEKENNIKRHEAKLILQMIFMKSLHLRQVFNGVTYKGSNGYYIHTLIEPGTVAVIARNIFETVSLFNLLHIQPQTEDQKNLIYNLWECSGLKYRQRFEASFDATDNNEKFESERNLIQEIIDEIENNGYYSKLNNKNKQKIKNQIKGLQYLIKFEDKNVKVFNWSTLHKAIDLKDDIFSNIYNYFSLYAHPSNVSVFQFQDMFKPNEFGFSEISTFNTKIIFCMLGVFVADLLKVFPQLEEGFNRLDYYKQVVIDSYNIMARSKKYAILDEFS